MTDSRNHRGWVFYDDACGACRNVARRARPMLRRRGFDLAPLQDPWVAPRLGIGGDELLREMKILTPQGASVGGADAIVCLAHFIWWARPLRLVARVPGMMPLLRRVYRWLAGHRYCISGACQI